MSYEVTQEDKDQIALFRKMNEIDIFDSAALEQDVTRNPSTGRILKGPDGADDQLIVTFSTRQVPSKRLTVINDGIPSYIDMDFITIFNPSELNLLKLEVPVTDYYKWRFPVEYKAFKAGKDIAESGTALNKWNALQPGQIEELKRYGITAVEQIGQLSDTTQGSLKPYARMAQKARNFLESIGEGVANEKLESKIQANNASRDAELDALKAQVNALIKLVASNQQKEHTEEKTVEAEEKPKMRFGKPIKPKTTE
jgi:hypothetical protein